ncbi:hypothetical protein [Candidatus Sarmatiella mevalonica]|uniref:hypothetical protein n=1 Tax=Candidatus Sarmatiella mevalonica TaxID=2770581 RepID=UPI001921FB56|nr:hypothetical protein [Candidatus Sarmatiella mevalonica]
MMSKCEEHTKHRAAAYIKYVRTRALTATKRLPSGVELGKRCILLLRQTHRKSITCTYEAWSIRNLRTNYHL